MTGREKEETEARLSAYARDPERTPEELLLAAREPHAARHVLENPVLPLLAVEDPAFYVKLQNTAITTDALRRVVDVVREVLSDEAWRALGPKKRAQYLFAMRRWGREVYLKAFHGRKVDANALYNCQVYAKDNLIAFSSSRDLAGRAYKLARYAVVSEGDPHGSDAAREMALFAAELLVQYLGGKP